MLIFELLVGGHASSVDRPSSLAAVVSGDHTVSLLTSQRGQQAIGPRNALLHCLDLEIVKGVALNRTMFKPNGVRRYVRACAEDGGHLVMHVMASDHQRVTIVHRAHHLVRVDPGDGVANMVRFCELHEVLVNRDRAFGFWVLAKDCSTRVDDVLSVAVGLL